MRCESWPVITGHNLRYSMSCEDSPHRSYCHPSCHWACRYCFYPFWERIHENQHILAFHTCVIDMLPRKGKFFPWVLVCCRRIWARSLARITFFHKLFNVCVYPWRPHALEVYLMTLWSTWTSFLNSIFKHNRQELVHKKWFVSHNFCHVHHQAKGQGLQGNIQNKQVEAPAESSDIKNVHFYGSVAWYWKAILYQSLTIWLISQRLELHFASNHNIYLIIWAKTFKKLLLHNMKQELLYEVPRKGPVPYSGPRPYNGPQRNFFAPFLDRYFTTQWSTITGPSPIAVHAPITVHGTWNEKTSDFFIWIFFFENERK